MTDFTNPFAAPEPSVPQPGTPYGPPPNPWAPNNDSAWSEPAAPGSYTPDYSNFDATYQPAQPVQSGYQPVQPIQPIQRGYEEPTYANPPVSTYNPGYPGQYPVAPLPYGGVPAQYGGVQPIGQATPYSPYGVYPNPAEMNRTGGWALGLGITSLVLSWACGMGILAAIAGIICGGFGIRWANEGRATNKTMSMIGLILSVVGIVVGGIITLAILAEV